MKILLQTKAAFAVFTSTFLFTVSCILLTSLITLNANAQGCSTDVTFSPSINTPTPGNGFEAAVADFNGDGLPDVAVGTRDVGNMGLSYMWIGLGKGDGSFNFQTPFLVGDTVIRSTESPWVTATNDFNDDGKADLVVTNYEEGTISVFLGNGDGTFQPQVLYNVGCRGNAELQAIAMADFNGDGKTDLAVVSDNCNSISILLGDGLGGFTSVSPTPPDNAIFNYAVAAADFNGDGKVDLVLTNNAGNAVYIYLGNGDGTFATPTSFGGGFSGLWHVVIADFNKDGKVDLALSNYDANYISVLLGNGDGTFGTPATFKVGNGSANLTIGDFNKDGNLDIVAPIGSLSGGGSTVALLLGDGTGSFASARTFSVASGSGPIGIATADFNGDGGLDILTSGYYGDVSVLLLSSFAQATADSLVCAGGSGTALHLKGGSSTMIAYSWSGPDGFTSNSQNPTISNPTSLAAGIYSLTVTDSHGCTFSATSNTVAVKSSGTLNILPKSPAVCNGLSINLYVLDSIGTNLAWSPSTGLNKRIGDTVTASLPNGIDSIVYTVTDTSLSGCPDVGTVTLHTGGGAVGGVITSAHDTICQNTASNLTLTGNSSNQIQWQLSTNDTGFSNAGDTTSSYKTTPLSETTWYRATVGTGSCSATSDTLQLIVPLPLSASFYSTQTASKQLTFNSDSSLGSIRNYHWDFGDGQTSTQKNPIHAYSKDTTYYVCLTLYDGSNCSYTYCRYSSIKADTASAVSGVSAAGNWLIYPAPFTNQLTMSAKQNNALLQSIEMYDVLGRQVLNKTIDKTINATLQLDVTTLAKGMYYVVLRTADADYVQKVVKQ